jgi:hypothetical protein
MSRKSEKENIICFIFGLVIGDYYYEGIKVNDWNFVLICVLDLLIGG